MSKSALVRQKEEMSLNDFCAPNVHSSRGSPSTRSTKAYLLTAHSPNRVPPIRCFHTVIAAIDAHADPLQFHRSHTTPGSRTSLRLTPFGQWHRRARAVDERRKHSECQGE